MADLTPEALAYLAEHHSIITFAELRRAGVGRRTAERLVAAGVFERLSRSVLRHTATNPTLHQRCAAVCAAHPQGFITGPTGGRLSGLRRMPAPVPVHLAVPHGLHLDPLPDVILRQTTRIDPEDVVVRRDGIRIASPPRLVFDLAADLGRLDHASVIEQVLHEERCTLVTLARTARRLAHPARPGSLRFVRNLLERAEGPAAESHPEVLLADALRALGVPVEVQVTWLTLPDGRRIRLDLSVPALRWGVEVDVHPSHLGLEGTASDKRRDRQCHLIGWQVERVSALDLLDLEGLARELAALYEARRALVES